MLVPKVTLQGKVGDTRTFIVKGRRYHFRAQVPMMSPRVLVPRLRRMKQASGMPLFKIEEVPEKIKAEIKAPTITGSKEQHVDGQTMKESGKNTLKNKRFAE